MHKISNLGPEEPASLAFPYEIGCGLGGGEWPMYDVMIEASQLANPGMQVTIVRWYKVAKAQSSAAVEVAAHRGLPPQGVGPWF